MLGSETRMPSNLSRGSIFCTYSSTEEIWDRLGGKKSDGSFQSSFMSSNFDTEDTDGKGMTKIEEVESGDPTIDDILDLLPLDPFEKEKKPSTLTAFTDWCKNFEERLELGSDCSSLLDESEEKIEDDGVLAEVNWVCWNSAVLFQPHQKLSMPCYESDDEVNGVSFVLDGSLNEFWRLNHVGDCQFKGGEAKEVPDWSRVDPSRCEGGEPHDAIAFALPYLGLKDLLSVEMVCKSLRDEVRSNTLLWRSICIEPPLNMKINDDALLNLTSKAQGTLESLTLMQCYWINNDGLKRVLDDNPKLKELSVPGCVRITVDNVLDNLTAMKSAGKLGIKLLRVGGIPGATDTNFGELKYLVSGEDDRKQLKPNKPRFYNGEKPLLLPGDDRAIDIEPCPKCKMLTLVYDCPLERCREKHQDAQLCRGCILCIERCSKCGRCIADCVFWESMWLDFYCEDCYEEEQYPQQEPQEEVLSPKCTVFIFG